MARNILLFGIAMGLLATAASAQIGAITTVGTTVNNLDALAFNSSGTLYGATAGNAGAGALYTINPANGAATLVHALVGASNSELTYGVSGLAFQSGTGTLYGSTGGNSPNSSASLVTINPTNGQVTVIGPSGAGPYTDIKFSSGGTLYGWLVGNGTDSIATINLATGAGTPVTTPVTNSSTRGDSLAISSGGIIYVAANGPAGPLWTWTVPPSGGPTTLATLSGGPGVSDAISAMAFSPGGVLYGIEGGDDFSAWDLVTISLTGVSIPATTPIPATWLLVAVGITCLALYQMRGRLLAMLRG